MALSEFQTKLLQDAEGVVAEGKEVAAFQKGELRALSFNVDHETKNRIKSVLKKSEKKGGV